MKKIKPSGNRVLIKIIDKEISPGGIVMPDSLHLPVCVGTVEAVGPGYLEDAKNDRWVPCSVKEGETVLVNKEAGLRVPKEVLRFFLNEKSDSDYVLLAENQIYGTIEECKEK